jgi:hypothetical protein
MTAFTADVSQRQAPCCVSCEFCGELFSPRAQTKKPRACSDEKCQKARQKQNQKAWREREKPYYPADYHRRKRQERSGKLALLAKKLCDLLSIGAELKNVLIEPTRLGVIMAEVLGSLGILGAKKLCPFVTCLKKGPIPEE